MTVKFTRQTVTIKKNPRYHGHVDRKVMADTLGDYAVHDALDDPRYITLTHIPTGICVWAFPKAEPSQGLVMTKTELRKQVKAVAALCQSVPAWGDDDNRNDAILALRAIVTHGRTERLF